jgi:hypothetical protein
LDFQGCLKLSTVPKRKPQTLPVIVRELRQCFEIHSVVGKHARVLAKPSFGHAAGSLPDVRKAGWIG